jgi:hypothetical protein
MRTRCARLALISIHRDKTAVVAGASKCPYIAPFDTSRQACADLAADPELTAKKITIMADLA